MIFTVNNISLLSVNSLIHVHHECIEQNHDRLFKPYLHKPKNKTVDFYPRLYKYLRYLYTSFFTLILKRPYIVFDLIPQYMSLICNIVISLQMHRW